MNQPPETNTVTWLEEKVQVRVTVGVSLCNLFVTYDKGKLFEASD